MEVTFYTINDDNNVLNKHLIDGETKYIVDIDGTIDLLNPSFKIRKGDLSKSPLKYNYCYIGNPYNRFYYMNAKQPIQNHIFNIECKVDVLMSFKEDILNQTAIIERSEKYYDTYIPDISYVVENKTRVQTFEFPNGFTSDTYVLTVCG